MGNQVARHAHRTKIDSTIDPNERNDRWLTPKYIVEALGPFDLDPCGAPGHVLAKNTYLLENGDDGLRDPWNNYYFMKDETTPCHCRCHQNFFAHGVSFPSQPRQSFILHSKAPQEAFPITVVSAQGRTAERRFGLLGILHLLMEQQSLAPNVARNILELWSSLRLTNSSETALIAAAVLANESGPEKNKLLAELTRKSEKESKLKSAATAKAKKAAKLSGDEHLLTTTSEDSDDSTLTGSGMRITGTSSKSFGVTSVSTVESPKTLFTKNTSSLYPTPTVPEQYPGTWPPLVFPATSLKEAKALRTGHPEKSWKKLATLWPSCTQCSTCQIGIETPTVYSNPPYNARIMAPWIERMIEHNNGILLIPASTGIKLWQDLIFPNATAIHFYRHRIEFLRREGFEGGEKMVSPQASAIIAFGDHAADKLVHSDLPGVVIDFR